MALNYRDTSANKEERERKERLKERGCKVQKKKG